METNPGAASRAAGEEGCAYGREPSHYDAELCEVGPRTPCGEFLRRYWHPVGLSSQASNVPRKVRLLGEDLILFRDGQNRAGLLTPRCAHRGTSLYYGKVDEHGIRCCYHGWQFDVEGRCIDQPCEPEGGLRRDRVRQPWYPVMERYGLVFAYLGPPAKRPVLPRWDALEDLGPDEELVPHLTSYGAKGDGSMEVVPWNWLQDWENIMDPFHVPILHTSFSGAQFAPEMVIMPDVTWEYTDLGMRYIAHRKLADGRELDRISPVLFPTVRAVPDTGLKEGPSRRLRWLVPIDDTHHCHFNVVRAPRGTVDPDAYRGRTVGPRNWYEMSEEEHQRFPSDWEAQLGQGPISLHSEEHLVTSDRGVAMLRRLIRMTRKSLIWSAQETSIGQRAQRPNAENP
ncbi:MAG: Rieske 2Fe-2S domain-containing protein [Burkholderiaceae bacterium]